jgi:FO synthase subunit 1
MIPGAAEYGVEVETGEEDVKDLLSVGPEDVSAADELSFARNIFIPLTTACRYTCSYCTYYDPPGQADLMSPREIREICRRGADAGCTEALFTFGDDPDDRYDEIYDQLEAWGHETIHEYLREACRIALEEGILPHSNPGDQTREQMERVADVNASMGVMLETTAEVQAHSGPRAKTPGQRLNTIRNAGELGIPFTTGILVGIGEDWRDRAESLLAIREMHERYDHIQEIIVQPVVENDRWKGGSPDLETLRRITAMARVAMPKTVSIQAPPNLASVRELLDCGIDDLGGVSPVTVDHINPEYEWPELRELEDIAEIAGVPLRERLPVYERFVADGWLSDPVKRAITADNEHGERYRSHLDGVSNVARCVD